jgi:hypothetical protein
LEVSGTGCKRDSRDRCPVSASSMSIKSAIFGIEL